VNGEIGDLLMVMTAGQGWDMLAWGSHWVDVLRMLAGDTPAAWVLAQVRASGERWNGDPNGRYGNPLEDVGVLYCGFADGVRGLLESGEGHRGVPAVRAVGTEGVLELGDESGLRVIGRRGFRTHAVTAAVLGPDGGWSLGSCFERALADLLAWREGGPEPAIGITNALATTEVMLAGYESALLGDRVDLPFTPATDGFALTELIRRHRAAGRGASELRAEDPPAPRT